MSCFRRAPSFFIASRPPSTPRSPVSSHVLPPALTEIMTDALLIVLPSQRNGSFRISNDQLPKLTTRPGEQSPRFTSFRHLPSTLSQKLLRYGVEPGSRASSHLRSGKL